MASVKSVCTRGIVLENGSVSLDSDVDSAISRYLGADNVGNRFDAARYQNKFVSIHNIQILNQNDMTSLSEDDEIYLNTEISLTDTSEASYHITYHLFNEMGEPMLNKLKCTFPKSFFQSGQFFLSLYIVQNKRTSIFMEKDIAMFTVIDRQREIGDYMGKEPGYIRPQFKWELNN